MALSRSFLVVDYHAESRFLLVKTLLRKFPGAVIHECDDADIAVEVAREHHPTAIVAHRTFDTRGLEVIRMLRQANPHVPIIMVSGMEREVAAREAGADAFLHYDKWLLIGKVVEDLLQQRTDVANGGESDQSQVA